jgi:MYXO-CTERM domain-containing protein
VIAFATCLGGGASEQATAVALDGTSGVVLAGWAGGGFPTTPGSFQPVLRKWNNPDPADNVDAFVARLDQDVDAEPDVLEFTGPAFSVYEDEGIAYLRVRRSGSGFGQVSLRVLCSDGTATAGQDYDDIDAGYTLSWANGQTGTRRHTILVTDDGIGEGTETVLCTLEAPGGYGLAVLGTQTSATLRIRERAAAIAAAAAADSPTAIAGDGGCHLAGQEHGGGAWLAALAALLLTARRRRR